MTQPTEFLLAAIGGISALLVLAASGIAQTRTRKKGDQQ
jgi:hypothetical protein